MVEEQPVEVPEEQPIAGPSPNMDPYYWVADEPRTMRSRFSGYPDDVIPPDLFTTIEDHGRNS
jgi:hypothetical protein